MRVNSSAEQCLFRFVWPRRVFSAIPTTAVERTSSRVVLWIAPETPVRWPRGMRLPIAELAEQRWPYVDARWYGGRLMIAEAGASHSVYVTWGKDGELVGWYVNLEERHAFGERTISTRDGVLDIWVPAETGEPEWKDEHELEAAVRAGRVTPDEAVSIRAEGERVWAERPWPTGWEDWRAPAGWTVPELPEGWDA